MKFHHLNMFQKGFDTHLRSIGVDPDNVRQLFGIGKTNKEVAKQTGHSEHAVGRWKKLWKTEQEDGLKALKVVEHNKAIDEIDAV